MRAAELRTQIEQCEKRSERLLHDLVLLQEALAWATNTPLLTRQERREVDTLENAIIEMEIRLRVVKALKRNLLNKQVKFVNRIKTYVNRQENEARYGDDS